MKLIERELGLEIEIKENIVSVLVLEDINLRLSLIEELYLQVQGKDGKWLLAENEKTFDLSKNIEMILEPFSLQLNNKKVKMKLYQDMKLIAEDFFYTQGLEVHSHICNYLENLTEKISYPIKYTEEWNLLELFKTYNVELEEECSDICEKLFHYINLTNQVCGIDIFVAVNLKQYLSENQLLELYKLVKYSKINLILIEFGMYKQKYDCEEVYILDKDDCLITY